MKRQKTVRTWGMIVGLALLATACKGLQVVSKNENATVPTQYASTQDTLNSGQLKWKEFFTDPHLLSLIDTALSNNQELNITLREVEIALNEIQARKGEYLPSVGVNVGSGAEKVGRYTSQGANDANTDISPGRATPEVLPDFMIGARMNWEVDIWHKLRNAKEAQVKRYLSTVEGKNFLVTRLIAEISRSYYELLALDKQLQLVKQNIEIQNNALEIVRLEKQAAKVTELAVRKFEAEVYHTTSLQYGIQQKIIETENRINFLVGRFPQPVVRSTDDFSNLFPLDMKEGIPSQLLENRTDIRQAELELQASKLDVKVAKAQFYPSLNIRAGIGMRAFNPSFFVQAPESIMFSLVGDLAAPLINRKALKTTYYNANAKQIQAVYHYEQSILTGYIEVANQLSKIGNLKQSYDLQAQQVDALNQSVDISLSLFASAKADYMEVLLTQRDALESKFDLVETKMEQMNAMVDLYKALGGGWRN